jgi:glycosyltransferase involved in cell wall biosynthesis
MKIASVTNVPLDPALGSGKTVIAWSEGLKNLGHEVIVYPPEAYCATGSSYMGNRLKLRFSSLVLEKSLLQGNFNLVEFYGAEFGLLINKLSHIPLPLRPLLVAHTNGLELLAQDLEHTSVRINKRPTPKRILTSLVQPIISKWDYWAFTKVDAFASICKTDLEYIIHNKLLSPDRCAVVEAGIDSPFLAAPWNRPKKNWIVHLGLWCSRKDPQTTVEVVSELLIKNPHLELHVLGASSLKETVLGAFNILLHDQIFVYPRLLVADLIDILSQAKILLLPSLYEGFGMATTEAMACGCVVVVTPTGFGAEINDGLDGFICNFRDVKAMFIQCQSILDNDLLRMQVASAARKRIVSLDWPCQVSNLEVIYKSWLRSIR